MARSKTCGSEEARQKLPELLARAERGGVTVITRRGKPCAAIVPARDVRARRADSLLGMRGTGAGLWGDVATLVARSREEWD